jgi:hypothetical protein
MMSENPFTIKRKKEHPDSVSLRLVLNRPAPHLVQDPERQRDAFTRLKVKADNVLAIAGCLFSL